MGGTYGKYGEREYDRTRRWRLYDSFPAAETVEYILGRSEKNLLFMK
jgi:hypothetical protein